MTTKEMARQALQKLHDAYNAIPNDDSEDFDRTHYRNFEKAMGEATAEFIAANRASEEAQMYAETDEWVEEMIKIHGTK